MAGQPKHEQVSEWLRERIRSGEWKDGDKLLSEHELARRFGISRQTVRQAVGTLVNEGLLLRRQGSGTYVAGRGGTPRSRSGTIGVVTTYLDRYVFPDIIHGIEQVLTAAGYQMQLGITHNRTQDEGTVLASMLKSRVDGLIVEPTKSALPNPNLPLYRKIGEENIPVIFLNGYYAMLDIPHVSADDYAAGRRPPAACWSTGTGSCSGSSSPTTSRGISASAGLCTRCRKPAWSMTTAACSGM